MNGFLIIPNNGTPNAICPPQQDVTAPGPYIVYGLNLPTDQYRLLQAGHPSHLPETTTVTYAPLSGVAEGEGYVTVTVSRTYRTPVVRTTPTGAPQNTYQAASYLPQPGISSDDDFAQWIGPGGLYTLSIDSAHSSLTLQQAAALLTPIDLSTISPTATPQATPAGPTPQPPPTGNGTTSGNLAQSGVVENIALLLFAMGTLLLAGWSVVRIRR